MSEGFTAYRLRSGYSEKTIKAQDSRINRLKSWCVTQNISLAEISYSQALQFIDSERERGILNQSIIQAVDAARLYFGYLLEIGTVQHNIIKRVKIRSTGKRVIPETLSPQQLERVYHDFTNLPEWAHRTQTAKALHRRNVVLLGLLVYQGLTSGETAKLETSHINLPEGKIYIPSTRKSNARTLKLQANQILPIKSYIESMPVAERGAVLSLSKHRSLFPTKKQSEMVCKVVEQAKKKSPELKDSRQIRASVIMNWLKSNNIRQVQYMAGHKSIKSTEQYRQQDLSDLTRQLELFHPLR